MGLASRETHTGPELGRSPRPMALYRTGLDIITWQIKAHEEFSGSCLYSELIRDLGRYWDEVSCLGDKGGSRKGSAARPLLLQWVSQFYVIVKTQFICGC